MAEQERLTKAERRELKRRKRQEEQEAAAARAARQRRRNISYAVSLFVVVGVLLWLAIGNRSTTASTTLARADAAAARESSGCEVLDVELIDDQDMAPLGIEARAHIDPVTAPAPDVLYVNGSPTASGPHYTEPLPIVNGIRDEPIDERASTHNLEHGAILVWVDDQQVEADTVDAIGEWVETLNESGFAENTGRAGIIASRAPEGKIDSGKAFAIRGWGVGMDCDSWDTDWANGFVIDHFGTRGLGPERFMEYPEELLAYADEPADDAEGDEATPDAEGDGTRNTDADADGGAQDGGDTADTDQTAETTDE